MRAFHLFIPGVYDDAFVYMSRLLAFTAQRTIRIWSLDRIAEELQSRIAGVGDLPTFLFARNDYLNEGSFRRLMSNREVLSAVTMQLDHFPQPHIEIGPSSFDQELGFSILGDSLLNVLVYKQRLYLGTEAGLFDINVDWQRAAEIGLGQPERRLESRCVHTTARFGAVLASCVDDGLWTAPQEFSLANDRPSFKHVPERSIRTGWLADDVANYRTSSQVSLLANAYTRPGHEETRRLLEDRETRLLTDVAIQRIDVDVLYKSLESTFGARPSDIQFLYNDERIFFAHTFDGKLFAAALAQSKSAGNIGGKSPRVKFVKEAKGASQTIISAAPVKSGVVFETDSEVAFVTDQDWDTIIKAGALSVRTFPMSKRFQNLVVSTLDNGILITSLFPYSRI